MVAQFLWLKIQGGVTHIYTVGRSATAVKLKVNAQFKIFSKVNGQADVLSQIGQGSGKILAMKLARTRSMQCCNKNFWPRL